MSVVNFDMSEEIARSIRKVMDEMKRVNVVIAGRSGVGKSTLINAVFQGNLAETGQGRPVTSRTTEYTKEGLPLAILDTRGLEMDRYRETVEGLEKLIKDRRAENDVERQPHVTWLCISEESRRVEEGESKLVELFARYDLPVVAVITKARNDQGFAAKVRELLPEVRNVSRVRALAEVDEEGNKLAQKGLEELIELTAGLVPEAQRNAFAAVQKVNLRLKKSRAQRYVVAAAGAAATVGAAPIPFADAVLLIPIETAMLAGISAAFGLPLAQASLSTIVSSSLVALAGTLGGRAIVGGLLKLIPGVGSVVGGAISGATAALLTTSFGGIYIEALGALFERNAGEPPSAEDVAAALTTALRQKTKP